MNQTSVLDDNWFKMWTDNVNYDFLTFLNQDNKYLNKLRLDYLNNSITPKFLYPNLTSNKIDELKFSLDNAITQIRNSKPSSIISDKYIDDIYSIYSELYVRKVTEVSLLKAVLSKDNEVFQDSCNKLFGILDENLFNYFYDSFRNQLLDDIDQESSSEIKRNAEILLKEFSQTNKSQEIETSDFPKLRLLIFKEIEEYVQTLRSVNLSEKLNSGELAKFFRLSLELLNIGDYTCEVSSRHQSISVNHYQKCIFIPSSRVVTKEKAIGLAVHEVYTHILRRINGQNSKLKILGVGIGNYQVAEEGIASIREQVAINLEDLNIVGPLYFYIGMVVGLDGEKKGFDDIFRISRLVNKYKASKYGIVLSEDDILQKSWKICLRIFRGTDCLTPGICFTKDASYAVGRYKILNSLVEYPESINYWNLGKFSPYSSNYVGMLKSLDVI